MIILLRYKKIEFSFEIKIGFLYCSSHIKWKILLFCCECSAILDTVSAVNKQFDFRVLEILELL